MTIVLASASPRRQELLARLNLSFTVMAADLDEESITAPNPALLVETLSREKAAKVSELVAGAPPIIAADTVVVLDGVILGKPRDEAEAFSTLSALSGRVHEVYTGVTVQQGSKVHSIHEVSRVRFRPLTPEEITQYIKTKEPMDKAGAYGIQGFGALLVSGIEGDYFNVMGLPLCRLGQLLSSSFGIDILKQAVN